jgi:Protein of unknown function (DUF2637)
VSAETTSLSAPPSAGLTRWTVTTITLVIAALSFAFCFGNCHDLCLSLGLDGWIAWLIGPSVDLSVIGLLVGVRYLASVGYSGAELAKPRRLLILCGLLTLALNTADALTHGRYGTAAVNAIGPILLICWSDVGPWLVAELAAVTHRHDESRRHHAAESTREVEPPRPTDPAQAEADLWDLALSADSQHRASTGRPISRDALRDALHIGRDRASDLHRRLREHAAHAARSAEGIESAGQARPHDAANRAAVPVLASTSP